MDLLTYQRHLEALSHGKRLPAARYVLRDAAISLGEALDELVARLAATFQIGPEFNVIKFRLDEPKVS